MSCLGQGTRRFSRIPRCHVGERFRENAAETGAIVAEEPPRRDFDANDVALPGQIKQRSFVTAVSAVTETTAQRAGDRSWRRSYGEDCCSISDAETVQRQARRVGEQRMNGHAAVLPDVKSSMAGRLHQIGYCWRIVYGTVQASAVVCIKRKNGDCRVVGLTTPISHSPHRRKLIAVAVVVLHALLSCLESDKVSAWQLS
jgi:hypothetical protein